MTKSQKIRCNGIIHAASVAAGSVGAGLAQLPCSDSAVIVPVQIAMTVALGKVFGFKLSKASAKSAMGTSVSTLVGRAASQFLVGWLPVAGNIINAATAGVITEGLGWIIAKEFDEECQKTVLCSGEEIAAIDEESILCVNDDAGDDNNDGKAKNDRFEIIEEIGRIFRVFQKDRSVG